MVAGEKTKTVVNKLSFRDVLDASCEGLMEQRVQYCLKRIIEMQGSLAVLERELDEFIAASRAK